MEERPDQCLDSHSSVVTSIGNKKSIWSCQFEFQMSGGSNGIGKKQFQSHPAWNPQEPPGLAERVPSSDSISAVHRGQRNQELRGGKGEERQGEGEDRV